MAADQWFLMSVAVVAVFWLIVLPYRLSKGVIHRLGYHAYCGTNCELGLAAHNVKAQLQEQYRAGMRQGMRGRSTFGEKDSDKMVATYSLLPEWKPAADDTEFVASVKSKYDQVRFAFDLTDDLNTAATALAVALGVALRQAEDVNAAFESASAVVSEYAGVVASEDQRNTAGGL